MSFESEAAMKEVASEALRDVFRRDKLKIIPEFDYGPGRADLVFADISEKYHSIPSPLHTCSILLGSDITSIWVEIA